MGNLTEHAKRELQMAGLFDESGDFYGGMTGKSVMELVEIFEKQGHSGMSAPMIIDVFSKVANFKIIKPITCTADEWLEVSENIFQNNRLYSVFKNRIDGDPYYLDAIIWKEKNGSCFTGTVNKIQSRQFIRIPFTPKSFYVLIDENRNIIDKKTLDEALKYYKQP